MYAAQRNRHKTTAVAIFCLLLAALLPEQLPASAAAIRSIDPHAAAELVAAGKDNPDFVILDIRTPMEFQQGHLPQAVLVDYYSPSFADNLKQLDKSKTYLVYCRSGNRSGKALTLFRELGFTRIYNLGNGIQGWLEAGFATEK